MAADVDAATLKAWLSTAPRSPVLDTREHGQYGMGHLFFASRCPTAASSSACPLGAEPGVRLVLCDDGDGVAARAAARAEELGYSQTHVLKGGAEAWRQAGYTLYAGVNVRARLSANWSSISVTPRASPAQALQAMREAGENVVIVDGRPFAEFHKMNIPGGICCPNGEAGAAHPGHRAGSGDPIVVNCAGARARSSARSC